MIHNTFAYSVGYSDAILDIISWFETPNQNFLPYGVKLNKKILCVVLRKMFNDRHRFMKEKQDFEFSYTLSEYGIDEKKYKENIKKIIDRHGVIKKDDNNAL